MKQVTIIRTSRGDEGTFGKLSTQLDDKDFYCVTGELPWRDNKTSISCIPVGVYQCDYAKSPSKGMCYHVRNVPDRGGILIHSANWMGDKSEGFYSQVEGCIALGMSLSKMQRAGYPIQDAITNSASTVKLFEQFMNHQPFELHIIQEDTLMPMEGR